MLLIARTMNNEVSETIVGNFRRLADNAVAEVVRTSTKAQSHELAWPNATILSDVEQPCGPLHFASLRHALRDANRSLAWLSMGPAYRAEKVVLCERAILALLEWRRERVSKALEGASQRSDVVHRALSATFLLFFDAVSAVLGDGSCGRAGGNDLAEGLSAEICVALEDAALATTGWEWPAVQEGEARGFPTCSAHRSPAWPCKEGARGNVLRQAAARVLALSCVGSGDGPSRIASRLESLANAASASAELGGPRQNLGVSERRRRVRSHRSQRLSISISISISLSTAVARPLLSTRRLSRVRTQRTQPSQRHNT